MWHLWNQHNNNECCFKYIHFKDDLIKCKVYAIYFQHCTFFEAKGIVTNIYSLELICLFIYQLSIKGESSYQSISKKW